MKVFAAMLVMVVAFAILANQAYAEMGDNMGVRPAYHLKRSLCNTFGGCGAKRSIQQQPIGLEGNTGSQSAADLMLKDKRETRASLIAEVLGDLVEHLRVNEKYKQGNYVVLVSKQLSPNTNLPLDPADLQELQVGRLYLEKNE